MEGDVHNDEAEKSISDDIIPDEALEGLPEEEIGRIKSVMRQTFISGVMRQKNPIAEKITSEHITQLIAKSDEQDKREREERKSSRNYNLLLIIIGLIFVAFLVVFLKENDNLLLNLVFAIVSFLGGFGFGKYSNGKSTVD